MMPELDEFTVGFLKAALWSSSDERDDIGGEPLDANYDISDFDHDCLHELVKECESFQVANRETYSRNWSDEQAGRDFWLTRNGHGAGFWDRGHENGDKLTKASEAYGPVDLYVQYGKVYASTWAWFHSHTLARIVP